MSPGVGQRPTPPPLIRLQGYAAPALDPPALHRDVRFSLPTASRAPSRPAGPWQSKGGGVGRRATAGGHLHRGLPAAAGPSTRAMGLIEDHQAAPA
ncbi:hypothetical protein A7O68_14835 [Listeria monocytogenes]|nr:hypothetical protein A7O68_14835 [Listeria monocytogenes]